MMGRLGLPRNAVLNVTDHLNGRPWATTSRLPLHWRLVVINHLNGRAPIIFLEIFWKGLGTGRPGLPRPENSKHLLTPFHDTHLTLGEIFSGCEVIVRWGMGCLMFRP